MHTRRLRSRCTPPSLADISAASRPRTLDVVHILRPLKLERKKNPDDPDETMSGSPPAYGGTARSCARPALQSLRPGRAACASAAGGRAGNHRPVRVGRRRDAGKPVRLRWRREGEGAAPRATHDCTSANDVHDTMGGNRKDVLAAVKRLLAPPQHRLVRDGKLNLRPVVPGSA
jgi:hypothetical protein